MTAAQRVESLDNLAKEKKSSRVSELLAVIDSVQKSEPPAAANLARVLRLNAPSDLKAQRPPVAALLASRAPEVRQPTRAARALADDSFDNVSSQAADSPYAL